MKKILLFLLAAIMTVALCACGNSNGTDVNPTPSVPETGSEPVAKVIIDGVETEYYNMTEAWAAVNNSVDKDSELVLLADWVAKDGIFGTGDGYEANGNLCPKDRKKDSIQLTIDLNGHKIDRNLSRPTKGGNIISIKKDGVFTIKNGTLTGGNTQDRGGALWLDNDETTVNLIDVTITGNRANGNGGAIFVKASKLKLNISGDTTIKGNSSDNYGGAMYVAVGGVGGIYSYGAKITLGGKLIIKDNSGKNSRNNICLQASGTLSKGVVHLDSAASLRDGSEIYLSFSDFQSYYVVKVDETYDEPMYESIAPYFHPDNSSQKIDYEFSPYVNSYGDVIYLK